MLAAMGLFLVGERAIDGLLGRIEGGVGPLRWLVVFAAPELSLDVVQLQAVK